MDINKDIVIQLIDSKEIPKYYVSIHGAELTPAMYAKPFLNSPITEDSYIKEEHITQVPNNLVVFTFTPLGHCALSTDETEEEDMINLIATKDWYKTDIPHNWGGYIQLFYPGDDIANNLHMFDDENDYFKIFELIDKDNIEPREDILKKETFVLKEGLEHLRDRPSIRTYGGITTQTLLNKLSEVVGEDNIAVIYLNCCNPLTLIYGNHNSNNNFEYIKNKLTIQKDGMARMRDLENKPILRSGTPVPKNHIPDLFNNMTLSNNTIRYPKGYSDKLIHRSGILPEDIRDYEKAMDLYKIVMERREKKMKGNNNQNSYIDRLYKGKGGIKKKTKKNKKKRKHRKKATRRK
tara:strand:+ start:95 stop:1144 length:1050 start_codon:yes stop_codon:yes gene_type:complete